MTIRAARTQDVERLGRIARAAYARYIPRIGREPAPMLADFSAHVEREEVWVLEEADKVVGYAVFYPRGDHIHLENVAVDPAFAARGYGKALIELAEDVARRSGKKAVELYTNQKMTENLGLYERLGYTETERRVEDGFQRVFFRKEV